MPASIGVNLRVTGHCRQGGRKYMEDFFSVAYQQTEDEKDLEYAFFGIYDGHGGAEAAAFAKEHLMETIIKQKNFWSNNDEDVLRAIKDGYIATHYAMWKEQANWPRTASGLPSTAGTTASVAFIRRGKIYIGHVGDSGIILGYQEPGSTEWKARPLTKDHKPENAEEMSRIESCGGKVVSKSGVPRVVWNRPKIGHQGPVRRSTPIDEIPFLAVARSLGDLWSYNSQINEFIVSPDPDCSVFQIDTNVHRCLIFGTDGLYNMLSPTMAVNIVQQAERHNEYAALSDATFKTWLNPSKLLVERALERWHATKMRADNTSVVTLMLDPPGPPRAQVLKDRKKNLPESGLKIMTRYDGNTTDETNCSSCSKSIHTSQTANSNASTDLIENPPQTDRKIETSPAKTTSASSLTILPTNTPLKERNFTPKPRESLGVDPREPVALTPQDKEKEKENTEDNTIQINEISSSNIEDNHTEEEPVTEPTKKLRSAKKLPKMEERKEEKRGVKRKLETVQNVVRKSQRISSGKQVKTEETAKEKIAPCTLAEEKLKKLAEDAENKKNNVSKLSLAQKILKSKKLTLKKKQLLKKPLSKQKIKVALQSVRRRTKKTKNPIVKPKKPDKTLEKSKISTRKKEIVSFQRTSERSCSLRQRKVQSEVKGRASMRNKASEVVTKKSEVKTTVRVTKQQSPKKQQSPSKEAKKIGDKKTNKKNSAPKMALPKKTPLRSTRIRNAIQQKTAALKRSVMRKK